MIARVHKRKLGREVISNKLPVRLDEVDPERFCSEGATHALSCEAANWFRCIRIGAAFIVKPHSMGDRYSKSVPFFSLPAYPGALKRRRESGTKTSMTRALTSLLLLGALLTVVGTPRAEAIDSPTLNLDMVPSALTNQQPSELIMTVESDTQVKDASLVITAPPCVSSNSSSLTLPVFSHKLIRTAVITGEKCEASGQKMPIIVELRESGASPQVLASQSFTFTYATELALATYLLLGCVGITIGYWLRLLVNTLATTKPTAAGAVQAADVEPPEGLKNFVKRHLLLTDFLVTLLLGILALLYLSHSGRPPDAAAQWPGALTLGGSLGVLTNSELFTRLGKP